MSLYGAFAKENHLSELDDPLWTQEGVLTPAQRRLRSQFNLGMSAVEGSGAGRRFPMASPATATNTATLTAAQITNGVLVATPTAAAAYTLPLAADLDTALPDFGVDEAFEFSVINVSVTATNVITMTTNTGWTLVGDMLVDENDAAGPTSSARFIARKTAAGAWTLYRSS